MKTYKNKAGNSGIMYYEPGEDYIKIWFGPDKVYLYNYIKPGRIHVERMKALADAGKGLSSYISRNVRGNYFK